VVLDVSRPILSYGQLFLKIDHDLNYGRLIVKPQNASMLRILATLAFAVSFDLLFFDGKYTDAAKQLALTILQHFGLI